MYRGEHMLVVESALGRALVSRLRASRMSLEELAGRLEVPTDVLSGLLADTYPLDRTLAAALASEVGSSAQYWLDLDENRRRDAWRAAVDSFTASTLRALRERGQLTATKKQPDLLARQLGDFFDCDPSEAASLVPASFRQSKAHPVQRDALSVWLKLASHQAARVAEAESAPPLDREALQLLLPNLVKVGGRRPDDYLAWVKDELADVGVVVVFQGDVPGTRLSGASWLSDEGHGVVALTLRYASDDFFWWTVFHECAHLLLGHGVVLDSLDRVEAKQETEADELAKALLLPRGWDASLTKVSGDRVAALAQKLDVPSGLLVGQLQHSNRVAQKDLNGLKKRMPKPGVLEVQGGLNRDRQPGLDTALSKLMKVASAS